MLYTFPGRPPSGRGFFLLGLTPVTAPAREQINARQLLDQLRKAVPSAQGLVITTVPRGGLQLLQPSSVPETLVKSYTTALHAEDRLTWDDCVWISWDESSAVVVTE